ncbi:MAG: cytochrome P460 family protein [Methylococcaceae bacterium]|nr:cytochrome P460 family protein [Methylococcaceae bacterium]
MKKIVLFLAATLATPLLHAEEPKPAPNGITLPEGYKNWRLIAVSQRTENQTQRAILGNDLAIEAARAGKTHPWPNGAILAKLSWKQKNSDKFPTAVIPGEFVQADFMVKDDKKFAASGGWGYARWLGMEQKVYDKPDIAQECLGCHGSVKDQDYVFTAPVKLP